ncbi:MAG: MBL fold metallo-hydrolase, partial [Gammaproteobacteria bacterium SG8_15]
LNVEMIVPQHGKPFAGHDMIEEFLRWFEQLECGIDNLHESHYSVP